MATYRPGTIRWFDKIGQDHHIVEPKSEFYSSAMMIAEDYWDDTKGAWLPINPPEKKDA